MSKLQYKQRKVALYGADGGVISADNPLYTALTSDIFLLEEFEATDVSTWTVVDAGSLARSTSHRQGVYSLSFNKLATGALSGMYKATLNDSATELISDGNFTSVTTWDVETDTDWTISGADANYTWTAISRAKTLKQTTTNRASAGIGGDLYKLVYTVTDNVTPDDFILSLEDFANTSVRLNYSAGTHIVYVTAAPDASTSDFTLLATAGALSSLGNIDIDDISLTSCGYDISDYMLNGIINLWVYLPSVATVSNVSVRLGTDTSNYLEWIETNVEAGWNNLTFRLTEPDAEAGVGANLNDIRFLQCGVTTSPANSTLTAVKFDGFGIARSVSTDSSSSTSDPTVSIPSAEYKSPSDFTAAFTSTTTLTLAGVDPAIVDDSQLVYVKVIPSGKTSSFWLVNGMNGVTFAHTSGTYVITIDGAGAPLASGDDYEFGYNAQAKSFESSLNANNTIILDDTGTQITAFGSPSTIAEYKSPSDFTAAYASTSTLTIAALTAAAPLTENAQLVYVRVVNAAGTESEVYVNGSGGITLEYTAPTLTITGATPFTAADTYEVGYNSDARAFDVSLNADQIVDVAPTYGRVLDPVVLSAGATLTDTFADFGSEIVATGYDNLGLYLNLDWGDSTNVQIKVLFKHTADHADEYQQVYLGSPGTNKTTLNLNVYEFATDADQKIYFNIPISNTVVGIQLQVKEDVTAGTGTLAGSYVLGYGS